MQLVWNVVCSFFIAHPAEAPVEEEAAGNCS